MGDSELEQQGQNQLKAPPPLHQVNPHKGSRSGQLVGSREVPTLRVVRQGVSLARGHRACQVGVAVLLVPSLGVAFLRMLYLMTHTLTWSKVRPRVVLSRMWSTMTLKLLQCCSFFVNE